MTTETQKGQILNWMKQRRGIDGMRALRLFGCWRLPARISELRKEGHAIRKQNVKLANGKTIARYRLA